MSACAASGHLLNAWASVETTSPDSPAQHPAPWRGSAPVVDPASKIERYPGKQRIIRADEGVEIDSHELISPERCDGFCIGFRSADNLTGVMMLNGPLN
jgi:hypothetical protein